MEEVRWRRSPRIARIYPMNGVGRREILERLVGSGLDVTRFQPVIPSLEEIFVRVAGEERAGAAGDAGGSCDKWRSRGQRSGGSGIAAASKGCKVREAAEALLDGRNQMIPVMGPLLE